MRKRPIAVLFRLNEQERLHLKEQAALAGQPTERFLRNLVAGVELTPRPPDELAEILWQLAAIGNNINQIAKIANTCRRVRQEDVECIVQAQAEIWRMVKRL